MKRKPTFTTSIGSISSLHPAEDPIGDLAYELRSLLQNCRVDRETRKAHIALLARVAAMLEYEENRDPIDPPDTLGPHLLLQELVEALEHYAPPYTWFGERENDRGETEYGFWPSLDDELPRSPRHYDENWEREHWGEDVLLVNDHGNVECGRFDKRGRWHEYWSCV